MDRFFYNNYYKYFLWNNGLLEHFFAKGKSEIMLYVDKQLLEEIGKNKGIEAEDYKEDFMSCVEHFCAHYNRYICLKRDPNGNNLCGYADCKYYSSTFCLKNNRRSDVLAVANHICTKGIKYYDRYEDSDGIIKIRVSEDKKALIHALPFFAIVIYVILKFDNGETQEWANVGENVSANSRPFIPELWELINQFDSRFDKDASVYDRSNSEYSDYAGRILYHLPLSASTRTKIQDAIYKSSIWKQIDSKSFLEVIGFIMNSLKDIKANDELRSILLKCYSSNDYKGISARKVQTVIDDFDIDAYESKIAERKQSADYNQTIVSGEFALGIYFPNDDEQAENSIVLLTTVQQSVEEKGFCIKEGKSGTLAGYNTSFVKLEKSTSIELKDYALKTNKYRITPLRTEDVIFFYEYDDSLFIQTRDIKPSKSYIVAVHKGTEPDFEKWCDENSNTLVQWPNEDTCDLFGNDWTIYYTESKLTGQYYPIEASSRKDQQDSTAIVMKGGIKKSNGAYFINALPYFEIPSSYDADDIEVYLKLNGSYDEDKYSFRIVDNKIIIDIIEMPIDSDKIAYVDICLEYNGKTNYSNSFKVCGQSIIYNPLCEYKYDRFGIITNMDVESSFCGNYIDKKYLSKKIQGLFQIHKEDFTGISDDLYFINLLAACCFDSKTSEITHAKFRKCISYAATRLNIDIQREGFISNAKRIFSKAGLIQIDYSTGKCQAVAPSFIRVPFSLYHTDGSQLQMLGGCYTRSFIADLSDYCDKHNVGIYATSNRSQKDEEKLLPPIILVGHNFSASAFSKECNQQCDVLDDNDFALSLLNVVPSYSDICSLFHFEHNSSYVFLSRLGSTSTSMLPRIRSMKCTSSQKVWYIEKENNYYAEVKKGLIAWASIYCHHEQNTPMMIIQRDYSVYLPTTLMLPNYVERALFLMNLGLPETRKVFVCGSSTDKYFSLLNKYGLFNETRCQVLANKLTGSESSADTNLVRNAFQTKHKMELYESNLNGNKSRERFMILKDNNGIDILAVAHWHNVYLNCKGLFYKIDADSVNKAMTFLIQDKWVFARGGKSIGYSKNGGQSFEPVFNLTDETLRLPDLSKFNKETIQIV